MITWSFSAVVAVLAFGACGTEPPRTDMERHSTTRLDADRGYSLTFPSSWHPATERMSRITEPRELFSVATVPLAWHETDCEAFAGAAGVAMGPGDVAVTVWERGYDPHSEWVDFPPRPERFGPVAHPDSADSGCGEPPGTVIHWRNFSDAGRHFHSLVRIGPDAAPAAVADAWRVLDRLWLDPEYRPGWRSVG